MSYDSIIMCRVKIIVLKPSMTRRVDPVNPRLKPDRVEEKTKKKKLSVTRLTWQDSAANSLTFILFYFY